MRDILNQIKEKARANPKRIVFPEAYEERILKAAEIIVREGFALPYLIGDRYEMEKKAREIGVNTSGFEVRDPRFDANGERYAQEYYTLRKHKGVTIEHAREILSKPHYFGAMMVHLGDADGMVSGTQPETKPFLPAFEIIQTKETFHKVSGVFLMAWPDGRLLFFADCSTEIDPDAKDLAEIAIDTAETAKRFGIVPRIAMLSFSTHGSAKHPLVDKVREATQIVQFKRPELVIDGEIQVDVALVPEIAQKKCSAPHMQGDANILIFPNLNAGNIAYKLVERLAKAHAIGPILQGLRKPVNDLSRGCSVMDIVDITAITVVEAQQFFYTTST